MSNDRKPNKNHTVTARELALDVLTKVEQEGAYSNLQLNAGLQKAALIREDVALTTELVYGTIARLNTLDYFLRRYVAKGLDKLQPWVRNLLRMSLYQLMYLDRIPPHAVVNEAVNIAKSKGHQGISGMVNGVLRSILRSKEELVIPEGLTPAERIALQHSHPKWLVKRWITQYGEQAAEEICIANNTPPSISVRVNTTMISREKLMKVMAEQGIEAMPSSLTLEGILIKSGGNMALTDWYRDGLLSVQDESSMLVAEAVGPMPGMRILDCCAAPGGKTAHMAELMKDDGHIIANDMYPHKEKLIREQAERLGLSSIETVVGDALNLSEAYSESSFDRILLDAPCSGLGVIRRKPDLKWAKKPADIEGIATLQYELLEKISPLLRVGGILVYSTCTIEPQENEEMVRRFLENHPQYGLAEEHPSSWTELQRIALSRGGGIQILPQDFKSDGFFIARIQRIS
ncbi:16S rRNA (cytosine(967)-C(5))-methyltransferase RsmB [Paenibacillus crassostreae]|uniref:16S rRNA (cytosine(967)-C(5))-methyltransferase RsmB n=1 Tax=Paenibacillus crassostreae TaxID=1763538 RepID=UPI0009EEC22A|nr:16S rRNA (cytosine(967)-C(5))-methyltransferase RsmB [Paenibacillus crassostreae]